MRRVACAWRSSPRRGGCSGWPGSPRGAPGPAAGSTRLRARGAVPSLGHAPREGNTSLPGGGGGKALRARSAGGIGVCGFLRTEMPKRAPRHPSVFSPRRAAAAPCRRHQHHPGHSGGSPGFSQPPRLSGAPAARGLSPRSFCPAPAGDKQTLNNGHVCSNMISPNNAE